MHKLRRFAVIYHCINITRSDLMGNNVTVAVLLTLIAGMATALGGIISLFTKQTKKKFLSASLGFSSGVMIYISFVEMFPKAHDYLAQSFGILRGSWAACASFFIGILIIMAIDNLIPSPESSLTAAKAEHQEAALKRMGVLTAVAICIHNLPEGLATFTSTLDDVNLGITMASAIAIHNIPEGIVTSVPIFYATGSKRKAFGISLISGITEPFGAIVGYLIMRPFLGSTAYGIIFAAIAGMMIYISVQELIPMAREYDKGNTMIFGFIAGMAIIAVSLMMFM